MDSPEHITLNTCYAAIVTGLSQSPNDIVTHIRSSGILAPGDIAFLSNPQNDNNMKAEKIINIVMIQVQTNPGVYDIFKLALERAGQWTASIVSILEETRTQLDNATTTSEGPTPPATSGGPTHPATSGGPTQTATSGGPTQPATSGGPTHPATSGGPTHPATNTPLHGNESSSHTGA